MKYIKICGKIMELQYIKDVAGNNYIGISVYTDTLYPFLNQLENILGDDYDEYVSLQQKRDHNSHHITVLSVMEFNKLAKEYPDKFVNDLQQYFTYNFDDIKMMGIGKASKNENTAYFVVINSEKIQLFRERYGLERKDLHITLGFKWKDVFGVPKNIVINDIGNFLKMIRKQYYDNNETFDFIKSLDNYDYDPQYRIAPIKMKDTYFTFKVGENDYISVSEIANKLTISAKWQDTKKIPIISNTLITRKFNF